MLSKQYCWISGEDLHTEDFQWIWAVLCGFDKTVALSEILGYSLPYAEDYEGFWKIPLTMQHPLAKIEIVPWDSSSTLILAVARISLMTLCSITRKAKTWKIILAGFKIAKRELTDESKSVSSLSMNNEKMLPNRCHGGA